MNFAIIIALAASIAAPQAADPRMDVRGGYTLEIAAEGFANARFMEFGPGGVLYVSQPNDGSILACRDANGDGVYDEKRPFVEGLRSVHGMQWHDGWLWFTQSQAIWRGRDTDGDGTADEREQILGDDVLPGGSGHWWRPILIHRGRIYTGVGDTGNITDETDTKRQKLYTYALGGTDERLFVTGIRNTEKLVVRPGSSEVWGMDHGSDWFGRVMEKREGAPGTQPITDLNPPEEMNHYVQDGFYGHPFLVGSRIVRYEYMDKPGIVELAERCIAPEWEGGAHWAANAMEFYTGAMIPDAKGDAFVAYHGSWNRTNRAGYCVTRVFFDQGKPYGELVYAHFLAEDGDVLGRPVDVVMEKSGALLISCDYTNKIFRLRKAAQ